MKEKKQLNAVHDNELVIFLEKMGIMNDIKKGNKKCKFCGERIVLEKIHSIFPDSGNVSIVCDNSACVKSLMSYISEKEL